jgi:hypothetical protein
MSETMDQRIDRIKTQYNDPIDMAVSAPIGDVRFFLMNIDYFPPLSYDEMKELGTILVRHNDVYTFSLFLNRENIYRFRESDIYDMAIWAINTSMDILEYILSLSVYIVPIFEYYTRIAGRDIRVFIEYGYPYHYDMMILAAIHRDISSVYTLLEHIPYVDDKDLIDVPIDISTYIQDYYDYDIISRIIEIRKKDVYSMSIEEMKLLMLHRYMAGLSEQDLIYMSLDLIARMSREGFASNVIETILSIDVNNPKVFNATITHLQARTMRENEVPNVLEEFINLML